MLLPICCCLSCQPETDDNKLSTNGDVRGQFLSISPGTMLKSRENSLKIKPRLSVDTFNFRRIGKVQFDVITLIIVAFSKFWKCIISWQIYWWTRDHFKMTLNESSFLVFFSQIHIFFWQRLQSWMCPWIGELLNGHHHHLRSSRSMYQLPAVVELFACAIVV